MFLKLYKWYQIVQSVSYESRGDTCLRTSMEGSPTSYTILTDITRYPKLDSASNCLKNTSAVPLAGGKNIKGHRTVLGPASYTTQTLSSSPSQSTTT